MKTDLFQSCGHCYVFQICWHIGCSTFTALSFGIPSPSPGLFIVMLPKAHLTLHSRISGSRGVITPSWLSGSWRYFLYSSVYSYHLFLVSSTSVKSISFCPLLCPSLHEIFPGSSNFLEKISNLSHSVVFLYFFALTTEEGFISSCYSLQLCIQMDISFLFSFAFSFSSFLSYL